MAHAFVALDYSRSLLSLCEQTTNTGVVHSIFQRAINIACSNTIVSITSDELQRTPVAMRLSRHAMQYLVRLVTCGMDVSIEKERFSFPAWNCTISLPETEAWEPRPDIKRYNWNRMTVAQHTAQLIEFLIAINIREGLGGLLADWETNDRTTDELCGHPSTLLQKMALPLLRLLMRASWQHDRGGIERAVQGLAGLGPGLTPSGDDVLVGFAAVMFLLSEQLSADSVSRCYIAEMIADIACPRTTLLSGSFLVCAARGEVSESLHHVLLGLRLPLEESETVVKAAERVLDFGATSGSDTLVGVLAGLRTLEGVQ